MGPRPATTATMPQRTHQFPMMTSEGMEQYMTRISKQNFGTLHGKIASSALAARSQVLTSHPSHMYEHTRQQYGDICRKQA